MNGSRTLANDLLSKLIITEPISAEVVVCPPYPYLGQAQNILAQSSVKLGAQDVSEHELGAYTGEVSAGMLRELGCEYVLVGHSERREYWQESNELVARKSNLAIASGLIPVVCVGESEQQRNSGQTEAVVLAQLEAVLVGLGEENLSDLVVAYEPVWAIGTGNTATAEQVQEVHSIIRLSLGRVHQVLADRVPILYGGSVNGTNANSLFSKKDVDGGLVGGASLDIDQFCTICAAAS